MRIMERFAPRQRAGVEQPGKAERLAYLIAETPALTARPKRRPRRVHLTVLQPARSYFANAPSGRRRPRRHRRPRRISLPVIQPRRVRLTVLRERRPIGLMRRNATMVSRPRRKPGRPPGPPKRAKVARARPISRYVMPAKPFPGFPLAAHPSGQWRKKIGGKHRCFGAWRERGTGYRFGTLEQCDPTGRMWRVALAAYQVFAGSSSGWPAGML